MSQDLSAATLGLTEADRSAAHAERFADFVALVWRLRRDCPWDREQTHDSVKHLTIEEAHELVEAIDNQDPEATKKELGDLLLHVLFHSHIAETEGTFTFLDVIEAEFEKLVRRHPHVFGDVAVTGTGEVLQNWEQIKRAEKDAKGLRSSTLGGVPDSLPALLRAQRVQEKAAGVGFDFPEASGAWVKVEEELRELSELAQRKAPTDALEDEFGDVLFALVNYGRFLGLTPENALRRTIAKFVRRFRFVEDSLEATGRELKEASLEEMDQLWDEAKAGEKLPSSR
ncbi:nucleoside triphosphate pyrophosphohydrolase [soil metagenome]